MTPTIRNDTVPLGASPATLRARSSPMVTTTRSVAERLVRTSTLRAAGRCPAPQMVTPPAFFPLGGHGQHHRLGISGHLAGEGLGLAGALTVPRSPTPYRRRLPPSCGAVTHPLRVTLTDVGAPAVFVRLTRPSPLAAKTVAERVPFTTSTASAFVVDPGGRHEHGQSQNRSCSRSGPRR